MNKIYLQSILKWGEIAIKVAAGGKAESAHIDEMFLGEFYSKETAVENCLMAMDFLIKSFDKECKSKNITILAIIILKYRKRIIVKSPDITSLAKEIDAPPEIYFLPKNTDIGCILDGEDYTCSYPLNTKMNKKYQKKQLFSFYRCWRGRDAIDNKWAEYERDIYRVFDPSGDLLW